MNKLTIQQIVDDPEWQALRGSFVGTWKKTPTENVTRLREYLGPMTEWIRLRRVLNYLTGSGFRMKVIDHPEIDKLLNEVRTKIDKLK